MQKDLLPLCGSRLQPKRTFHLLFFIFRRYQATALLANFSFMWLCLLDFLVGSEHLLALVSRSPVVELQKNL
jgi:hypothetical protein